MSLPSEIHCRTVSRNNKALADSPDDSYINCKAAQELGWTAAHLVEEGVAQPDTPASQFQIQTLEELRAIYPQLFKGTSGQA